MKPTFDILVAGELNPDLILSGNVSPSFGQVEKLVETADLTVGSSSAIFACAAARLGLRMSFIGVCGPDIFGRFMLDELARFKVDVTSAIIDPGTRTGLSVILNRRNTGRPGDRAILTYMGAIDKLRADQVTPALMQSARHVHVASYYLQTALRPDLPDLFRRAHSLGLTTSLDTNWDPDETWRGIDDLLTTVDVFLPNENEALAITGASNVEKAIEALNEKCKVVAVKCGRSGAVAGRGGETASAKALPVQVADTVGAGDNFDAGFLYGWLNEWSLVRALHLGTACGSLSTRLAGGTTASPDINEALSYVASYG